MEGRVERINIKEMLTTIAYYIQNNVVAVDAFIHEGKLFLKPSEKPNSGEEILGDLTTHV